MAFEMSFSVLFSWSAVLVAVLGNPFPSDPLYADFYASSYGVQDFGDSFIGDVASIDLSVEGYLPEQEGFEGDFLDSGNSFDSWSLWGTSSGDVLPQDGFEQSALDQDPTLLAGSDPILSADSDPGLWVSSCDGAQILKRDNIRARDDGFCRSVEDAPLNFKPPTLPSLPQSPSQTEIIPTLGRLRLGTPPGILEPICIEPFEHHLCCDGPLGEEAVGFGRYNVFTPVKDCLPGSGIVPCTSPPPLDVCCQTYMKQSNGNLLGVFCFQNKISI
jgi:hypothetical protein